METIPSLAARLGAEIQRNVSLALQEDIGDGDLTATIFDLYRAQLLGLA